MKKKNVENVEIEQVEIPEIEHQTEHPDDAEINLQNVNFAPGENSYLTGTEDHQNG
ncbi:hypothetical protein HNQ94_003420 [Salirhabdus euzebyi]|uniref:Uncharacterized protein n=1 Tax=Salirhabdus euzebyi TaxID=394506 RepID=A0A841Q8X9_9BACI|nr:hypothetical protein [Salirhabdus euzebyi]MBB6454931.1 hypothetical protein [Salirhabdus euzebyi]